MHHDASKPLASSVGPSEGLGPRAWAAARQYGLPIAVGYFPVAAAFGLLARQSGLSVAEAVFLSTWIYAGASQFLVVGMVAAGVPWTGWFLAGAFINLRHVLFAVAMTPHWKSWSRWQKAVAGFGLTDEVYAVVATGGRRFSRFPEVVGPAATAYVSWIAGTVVGAWGSLAFPQALAKPLEFALPALFLALLVPSLTTRPTALAALVGGSVSLAVSLMGQGSWGIVLGGVLGALVGGLAATSRRRGEARGREEGEAG